MSDSLFSDATNVDHSIEPVEDCVNPYAPPREFADANQIRTPLRWSWFRATCIVQIIVIALGCVAALLGIETIVASGPLHAILGCILAVLGRRQARSGAILIGISAVVFVVLVTALININQWSPSDAYWPVNILICIYAAGVIPLLFYFFAYCSTSSQRLRNYLMPQRGSIGRRNRSRRWLCGCSRAFRRQ